MARVVFDECLNAVATLSSYYDAETNGLCRYYDDLRHITEPSEQSDLIRINSRFTTNQIGTMHKAIELFGVEKQSMIVMEELAELTQAVSKINRRYNQETRDNLIEEMADVYIILEQLELMRDIDEEDIDDIIDLKMKRLKERIEEVEKL